MTEHRRFAGQGFGHPGDITYTPNNNHDENPTPGGLLTSQRLAVNTPQLRFAGSPAEIYPPSRILTPPLPSRKYRERHDQATWLHITCPEVSMSNSVAQQYLKDDMEHFGTSRGTRDRTSLLAFGEINTVLDRNRSPSVPVLAVATGESGQMIRIVRIEDSKWKWDESQDVTLNFSIIEPESREEEVLWTSDGLPISQIKFAISTFLYEPVRWLLVQKETSTTILRPEYHQAPVVESKPDPLFQTQALSRINPNPIVRISHQETGGNAHVDVVFNPASDGHHAQIIVLDECGYWTLWDIVGSTSLSSKGIQKTLIKRGHSREGLIDAITTHTSYHTERRGALMVGGHDVDGFWASFTNGRPKKETARLSQRRSRYVLFWDKEKFRVFDLQLEIFLPELPHFTATRSRPDYILDVQQSPVNFNHVFVLTREWTFLVDTLSKRVDPESLPRPRVLIASPHIGPLDDLVMTITHATEHGDPRTTLVMVCSSQTPQASFFWFHQHPGQQTIRLHRQVCILPDLCQESPLRRIRQVSLHAAPLKGLGGKPTTSRLKATAQFYQLVILADDLGVQRCLAFATPDQSLYLEAPTLRVAWTQHERAKRWAKKRKYFLNRLGKAFVAPDGIFDKDMDMFVRPGVAGSNQIRRHEEAWKDRRMRKPQPLRLTVRGLCDALQAEAAEQMSSQHSVTTALLDAIRTVIADGISEGGLPLVTWYDVERGFDLSRQPSLRASTDEIQTLLEEGGGDVVLTRLDRSPPDDASKFPWPHDKFARMWLDFPQEKLHTHLQAFLKGCIDKVAHQMSMSTMGLTVSNAPLFGDALLESRADSQRSSKIHANVESSQPSSSYLPSSPPESPGAVAADPALRRLSLLAPVISPVHQLSGDNKTPQVLTYWPVERGVSTQDYVSSVASQTGKQFDEAKQRLQRKEAKRKAQAERYKRPAFMRQGFPEMEGVAQNSSQSLPPPKRDSRASTTTQIPIRSSLVPAPLAQPQIMTSQGHAPPSSQSQGIIPPVTMSQPISGAFGDRKRVKKPKKKSGFR